MLGGLTFGSIESKSNPFATEKAEHQTFEMFEFWTKKYKFEAI